MRAMSCVEASDDLEAVIARVVNDCTPLAITRERGEGAVLVSASAWASIEETLYLLRSPRNAECLVESIAELEVGRGETHALVQP